MAKHDKGSKSKGKKKAKASCPSPPSPASRTERPRLGRKEYEAELERLQGELVQLQLWVVRTGAKIAIVFEGRDTAGKGGVIKRIMERVSPRVFHVIALAAPTEREKSQMYVQRYVQHFPGAGEVMIFDRSWYNRAGVERVMGFCTEREVEWFLRQAPAVEQAMVESGIIVLKYWLEVGQEEQSRRLRARVDDPRKVWKLSPMDVESYSHWYDYSRARDAMLAATDTPWAPWFVVDSNDKRRARLNVISHILDQIPYEPTPAPKVEWPARQAPGDYVGPERQHHVVPDRY